MVYYLISSASLAALITSAINIGILTVQHGHQLGWICLGSCGTDVIINAIAVFWVTNPTRSKDEPADNQSLITKPNEEQQEAQSPIEFQRQSPRASLSVTLQPPAQAQRGSEMNSSGLRIGFPTPYSSELLRGFPEKQFNSDMLQVMPTTHKRTDANQANR
ncbi:hypothetical protein PQX77_018298 [Marasmius sp. AFHP31]|nr:hypothetical protein PQX77_018298 [Marasmius sp. AFHP31]